MNYTDYERKYINMIKEYSRDKTLYKDYKIYEYLYAIELGMIVWEDIPPVFCDRFDIPNRKDYGIDLIDLECTKTCQVKYYGHNFSITWTHFSTFNTFSEMIDANERILATTTEAKIVEHVEKFMKKKNIALIRKNFDELIKNALNKYGDDIAAHKHKIRDIKTSLINIRDYQFDCYVLSLILKKKILRIQLPCGTGKSYIMLYTIYSALISNKNDRFIIFCPWKDLAYQMYDLLKSYNILTCFVGDGKHVIDDTSSAIVCVNFSIDHVIKKGIEFKYKFIDEAHHLETESLVIRNKINKIKAEKEINFSATFNDQNNLDYNYSIDKAITEGWISDYIIHVEYFTKGDRTKSMIGMICDNMGWAPMFIYFNTTDRAIDFCEELIKCGIKADYLIGKDSDAKRKKVKDCVINGIIKVVCLCGVYNEGISIDNLQTVVFGDLRHSWQNKVQIAMRANRKYHGKPFYRIILPVVKTDFTEKDVNSLIKTFSDIDPRIKNELVKKSGSRIRIRFPDIKNGKCDDGSDEAELLYEEVYDRLRSMLTNTWYDNFNDVKKYIDDKKMKPSMNDEDDDVKYMSRWLLYQKNNYPSRLGKMKDNDIYNQWTEFVTDPKYNIYIMTNEEIWQNMLFLAKKYIDQKTSSTHDDDDNARINTWLRTQQYNYKLRKYIMKNEIARNQWSAFANHPKYKKYIANGEYKWQNMFNEAKKYVDEHNKRPSKCDENVENKILGAWIITQQKKHKTRKGVMKNENIYEQWATFINHPKYRIHFASNKDNWINTLKCVKKYIDDNNMRPNHRSTVNEISTMGVWICNNINCYKKNVHMMKDDEINSMWISFTTHTKYKIYFMTSEDKWINNLSFVMKYMDRNDKRPSEHSKDKEIKILGNWISNQVCNYKTRKNIMSNDDMYDRWTVFVNHLKYQKFFG